MNVEAANHANTPCTSGASPAQSGEIIDLPVAGRVFARSRFAPAGKSKPAILPSHALNMLEDMLSRDADITEVQVSGPGDPLADIAQTIETLREVHKRHADLRLSIITLGYNGGQYAKTLADCGINSVTLLIDAIDPTVIGKLYLWIRPATKTVPLPQASVMLAEEQLRAIPAMVQAGITVSVKTTVYPGINDNHIQALAEAVGQLGAKRMILVPCSPFAEEQDSINAPDSDTMSAICEAAGRHIPLEIADSNPAHGEASPQMDAPAAAAILPKPTKERPNVAVVSSNGMEVDLHLGQAVKALVFGPREDGLTCLLETRTLPEPGGGKSRWETLAATLSDCFALLAAGAGENPRNILGRHGITTFTTEGDVDGMVDVLYGGGKKGKQCRSEQRK